MRMQGSYAEYAAVVADRLVPVPQGVSEQQAAAAMLQGMTAHYLSHDTYPLKQGETALVHAAAGGVGLLLVQMAHNIGARVIATVSTEEKAKLARAAGAHEVILYTQSDFEAETKRLTGGKGVDVVYDSVGKTTFEKGLNVLRPARNDGALRRLQRRGPALRSDCVVAKGIALRYPPHAGELHCHSRRTAGPFQRSLWHDSVGQAQSAHRAYLPA